MSRQQECLADPRVQSVLSISRSPTGRTDPKLREVIRQDFFAYNDLLADFAACDAATTTANLGRALIRVAAEGYSKPILHSRDINALGG